VVLGVALALLPGVAAADGIMLVQAGAFWMGSDSDIPNEASLHRVYVRHFWIDRHKVTNAEFTRFLNTRGARSPEGEDYFGWAT
jgi:formylglycine-generating enzyme